MSGVKKNKIGLNLTLVVLKSTSEMPEEQNRRYTLEKRGSSRKRKNWTGSTNFIALVGIPLHKHAKTGSDPTVQHCVLSICFESPNDTSIHNRQDEFSVPEPVPRRD